MDKKDGFLYPLPISRSLRAAEQGLAEDDYTAAHAAVMRLADAVVYYLGAVSVGLYSQALYTGKIEPDPTLNRSLRNLRRVLPGQWLGWTARGMSAVPGGSVAGLAEWYFGEQQGEVAEAYSSLRDIMVNHLMYSGEYGPREQVSPRQLLELIDQYRIRRSKIPVEGLPAGLDKQVVDALLPALKVMLASAGFLPDYILYAPGQRQLLMGEKPVSPMPPVSSPTDVDASILLYPPGEAPDYTKRPNLQAERLPLFPLDPLLVYIHCPQCNRHRVAALQEVISGSPTYLGLDPDCGHTIRL